MSASVNGPAHNAANYEKLKAYLKKKTPVESGEVGSYGELAARGERGDNLTPHYMPLAALNFTERSEGGSLCN